MTRNRNNGSPRIIGTGGAGMTFQRITLRDTILGIVLPGVFMIGARLLMVLLAFLLLLAIGRQAAGVISTTIAFYLMKCAILDGKVNTESVKPIGISLAVSTALIFIETMGYWPSGILDWQWSELRMMWSSLGGAFVPATAAVVIVRLFALIIVPLVVWSPARYVDWAFGIEIVWPIARETRFAQADPESIPGPRDMGVRASRQRKNEQSNEESVVVSIPQPDVQGR